MPAPTPLTRPPLARPVPRSEDIIWLVEETILLSAEVLEQASRLLREIDALCAETRKRCAASRDLLARAAPVGPPGLVGRSEG